MPIKTHKRKKSSRYHGRGRGTCGTGSRKNKRKSGHKGGVGMAGTGKRADQKKTLVTKLYGNKYFGKQGITSKGTKKKKEKIISLGDISMNIEGFIKKGLAKKITEGIELNLKDYKILSQGEIKKGLIITARGASKEAINKIKKAGGEIKLSSKNKPIAGIGD